MLYVASSPDFLEREVRLQEGEEPYDNIDQLMLSPTVLKAVDEGQFAIYPVRRIEDALQLLTGMQAGRRRRNGSFTKGTLYDLVDRRLERLGEYGQNAFRRQRKH